VAAVKSRCGGGGAEMGEKEGVDANKYSGGWHSVRPPINLACYSRRLKFGV
jgi:hypothetical protein